MKQTINEYQFTEAFRAIRPDNFSYKGLQVLFEYLEQLEDDIGEEIELDVIAICCDYSEDNWQSIADDYGIDTSDCENDDEAMQTVEEYLLDNTMLVGKVGEFGQVGDDRFIYQSF